MISPNRTNLALVAALLVTPAMLVAACLGDIDVGETTPLATGGGGAGGLGGSGGSAGEGGEGCLTPPDGYCDEESDCACTSCAPAAACMVGGCMANGFCELTFEDSCVCSDCDSASDCLHMFGGGNCTDDGACDSAVENCACADCFDEPTCLDNQDLCAGGAPDGQCTPLTESCSCNDCLGSFACKCQDDAICDPSEDCVCTDCWTDSFCTDPLNCTDDAVCDSFIEGCHCADCAPAMQCNGFP
jgi:hypothetical protein